MVSQKTSDFMFAKNWYLAKSKMDFCFSFFLSFNNAILKILIGFSLGTHNDLYSSLVTEAVGYIV